MSIGKTIDIDRVGIDRVAMRLTCCAVHADTAAPSATYVSSECSLLVHAAVVHVGNT